MVGVMLLEGGIGWLPWQANASPSGDLGLWEAASLASILLHQCQALILWGGFHSHSVLSNRNIVATRCPSRIPLQSRMKKGLWLNFTRSYCGSCCWNPSDSPSAFTISINLEGFVLQKWLSPRSGSTLGPCVGRVRGAGEFILPGVALSDEWGLVDMDPLPQMAHTVSLSSVGLRSSCPQCWLVH